MLFFPLALFGIDPVLTLFAIAAFLVIGVLLTSIILFTKAKFVSQDACTIRINHDDSLTKVTKGGQTLLNALTSSGIPIPSPCGGKATCKQCRVQIIKGAGEPIETDKGTFTKKQLKEGWRLSCQTKMHGDLDILVEPSCLSISEIEATVVSNENVATFIKELIVEVPKTIDVSYKSGEYFQFKVPPFKTNTEDWKQTMEKKYWPDWEKFKLFGIPIDFSSLPTGDASVIRAYSMASYPEEGNILKFNIRIATPPFVQGKINEAIPWGICSTWTFSLKPGDKINLLGPFGESLMKNDDRELIFLIGGAGSSFGRSHIMHLFRTEKTKRKLSLWYGARSLKENIYEEDYRKLAQDFPNFQYNLVLSEPLAEDIEAGWPKEDPIRTNFLFRAFEQGQLKKMEAPEDCLYYVCGPPLHNSSVMKLLDDYGVSRENIVLDDFGS
ncbi:NADH:ubiquinone reductase (Na(+)-transporting) subunit F [Criblamydia sequanensis]|uniref:Na(+)-translocating NADH-quinone reductase subunit F n=1 Tax=Candidatus Criblamydia sequanensis CRIB-18 TaxID=1437425 RepID=A0A090D039_9BACT|nr:NADH:ubiquinone reductase (Na(+)-transporting) subunit F [Criblamydia sequanensis]CDR32908.1 Na(+)-translocating NADH-quinone reductase subunit F [Criblamydia sequanensis CRIB-18]